MNKTKHIHHNQIPIKRMGYEGKISVPAKDRKEAQSKLAALASLATQLDGKALTGLSRAIPRFKKDPVMWQMIKSELGI